MIERLTLPRVRPYFILSILSVFTHHILSVFNHHSISSRLSILSSHSIDEETEALKGETTQDHTANECLEPGFEPRQWGFRGDASGKEPTCQSRRYKRCVFNLWVRRTPWRRAWQPTPVFLPEESHGQRSLATWGQKESDMTEATEHTARLQSGL